MKRILLVVAHLAFFAGFAQQNVFNRSDSNTGDWGSGNLPWFYQSNPVNNQNQGDPDNNNTTRNDVFIGHNNNTTMSLNGRFYIHRDFTFQIGASVSRILNNTTNGGFSFTRNLINQSSVLHTFNTPVGVDATNASFEVSNASGSLLFNGPVFTNNHQIFLRGVGAITFAGTMGQGGNLVKQSTGTFILSGNANFTGNLFIDEGILRADRDLGSGSLDIGSGVQAQTANEATFEISSGTFSKSITVKNVGTGAGNRNIRFVNTTGKPTIASSITLEKSVALSSSFEGLVAGAISGSVGIAKQGVGLVELTAQNTYTGLTEITAGVLQLNRTGGTTLPSTNTITVAASGTLRVSQNQTLAALTINGGTVQVDAGVVLTVTDLNSTGGTITGAGTVRILNVLAVSSGTFTTNNNVVLVSNALGTARVAPVGGTIAGEVVVERYIAGRRAFRFLTPGVTTTTSIFENWQNNGVATAGIGTHITGGATGGFDVTETNNPSLHTYDAQATGTTTGFTAALNTNATVLKAGVGYRLLVRGDRFVDLTAASTENVNVPTTLSAKGTLKVGQVVFSADGVTFPDSPVLINNQPDNTQTNGYTLIGNPYASPVDWHAVAKTGVKNNAYYTWDPTLGTTAQRGRYVVYAVDGNGVGSTNLFDDNSPLAQTNRQFLQSGQAVFIKNDDLAVPATLTFEESDKATTTSYVFRSASEGLTTTSNSKLFLSIYEPNVLALGGAPIDSALALFGSNYNNSLDTNDVDKLTASGENVAFVRENKNLAIETLAPVQLNDELYVKTISFQANKNYTFKVNTQDFDTTVNAKMVDLYLNTETPIDVTQPSFVTFNTTTDAASYGANRFKIVFNSASLANESFNKTSVAVYPNPIVNNQFTIALPSSVSGLVTVSMSNMLGQEVFRTSANASTTMNIQPKQQLEEGIYVVSISNAGQVVQAKVVVKK